MTYQVCILDSNSVYQVLFEDPDGNTALAWYDARVAEDFATSYSMTPTTYGLVIPAYHLGYTDMTTAQKNNIDTWAAGTVQFLLAVCF